MKFIYFVNILIKYMHLVTKSEVVEIYFVDWTSTIMIVYFSIRLYRFSFGGVKPLAVNIIFIWHSNFSLAQNFNSLKMSGFLFWFPLKKFFPVILVLIIRLYRVNHLYIFNEKSSDYFFILRNQRQILKDLHNWYIMLK